jgi:hypothetical protein
VTAQPLIPVLADVSLGTGNDFGGEVNLEVVEGIRTVGGCLPADVRARRSKQLNEAQRLFGDEPRLKLPNPFMSFSPAQERLISITLR